MIPFQTSKGMTIVGSWIGEEDEDLFVRIRRLDSEEDRERLYKAVYETDEWKNSIGPKASEMLQRGRSIITRMDPTPVRLFAEPRLFCVGVPRGFLVRRKAILTRGIEAATLRLRQIEAEW